MTANELISAFRDTFGQLEASGLIIVEVYGQMNSADTDAMSIHIAEGLDGDDEVIPGSCHISILNPFIFDGRNIPDKFMGVNVFRSVISDTVPLEIEERVFDPAGFETSWTPEQFKNYVIDNALLIRKTLMQPDMSFEDMLDAICFGSYDKYVEKYEKERLERLI
jgi:hypothetical protein